MNPATGINYVVAVQTPQERIRGVGDLLVTPVGDPKQGANPGGAPGPAAPYLGSVSVLRPRTTTASITHDTVQPVVEVQFAAAGRDLGAVASEVARQIRDVRPPPGTSLKLRGQSESMFAAFGRLALGLVLAIVLVYLLLVVLFQSWSDPLIILGAVPGALVGILWLLALTGTTLNVESFMGAIMAVGIATSNSILLVSFANDFRAAAARDPGPVAAMRASGRTRLRPVLMTALAMILGMLPMALGLGEGGEQNAPLGRAVIGGLLAATFTTLFLVPVVYAFVRREMPRKHALDVRFDEETRPPGAPGPAPAPGHA